MSHAMSIVLVALASSATAEQFFWGNDAAWSTTANWVGGKMPAANKAEIGVIGDAYCANRVNTVTIAKAQKVTSGDILLGEGVSLIIEDNAELDLKVTKKSASTVKWACRSEQSADYRCADNWFTDKGLTKQATTTPGDQDSVVFSGSISHVNNEQLPLVKQVTIGDDVYKGKKFGDIPESLFAARFIDPAKSKAGTNTALSSMSTISTCINQTSNQDVYRKYLESRMAFIEDIMCAKKRCKRWVRFGRGRHGAD
jgi:hypothetical protein